MTQLWRVHLAADGANPRRFCIDRGIVGVGWPVEHDGPLNWDGYEPLARKLYQRQGRGWATALNALYHRMQVGDLCWSRDLDGIYYLGRLRSPWRYENTAEHRAADIVNVRDAEWVVVGTADRVPGTVLRHFIRGQTIRQIPDATTLAASMFLFNRAVGRDEYPADSVAADLYQLLSPPDLENLVAVYLQCVHHYFLIPRTADASAPKYEFSLIREDGRRAAVQVKSGGVIIYLTEYAALAAQVDELFLFASSGNYVGERGGKFRCIDPEELRGFASTHVAAMPGAVRIALDVAAQLDSKYPRDDA